MAVPKMKPTRGRPRAHEQRQDDILDAAYRTFVKRGFHDTRVEEIARSGRIGHGAMYRYFGTKLDLFKRVVERAAVRVAGIVASEQASGSRSLADYEAQLWRIGQRLEELIADEPEIVRFLLDHASGVDPGVDEIVEAVLGAFAEFTAEYLKHGKKLGYLRPDLDVPATARLINAMILETVRQVGRKKTAATARTWMRALIRLMIDGVRA
jgi:TetR/AcrR family fatty acid metabolism transcriptional regulator